MPGMDPKVLVVIVLMSISVWLGQGVWKEMKKVGHKVQAVAHKILHPKTPVDQP